MTKAIQIKELSLIEFVGTCDQDHSGIIFRTVSYFTNRTTSWYYRICGEASDARHLAAHRGIRSRKRFTAGDWLKCGFLFRPPSLFLRRTVLFYRQYLTYL